MSALFEIISRPELSLPIHRTIESVSIDYSNRTNDLFYEIEKIDKSYWLEHKDQFLAIRNGVIHSLSENELGKPHNSYNSFANAMNSVNDNLMQMPIAGFSLIMYRARKTNTKISERSEIFHVPIQLRSKIGNERYSISGYPVMYASDTINGCLSELESRNAEYLYISKIEFKPKGLERLLSITDEMGSKYSALPVNLRSTCTPDLKRYLVQHILSMACCYATRCDSEDPFKVEYVIPQHLMSWILDDSRYVGVCFRANGRLRGHNYAFPAKSIDRDGYSSSLKSTLRISKPLLVSDLNNIERLDNLLNEEPLQEIDT